MTRPTKNSEGFLDLWPTALLERSLPGHAAANQELLRLITEMERTSPDLTTQYLEGNFLIVDNPAVTWLRTCVNQTLVDYLRRAGLDYEVKWSLQAWPNINRLGDYHDPHNHPHAYLSGTYYVSLPQGRATKRNRADLRPGAISFYDPRGAVNMTAIKGDPQIEAEYTLRPEPGTLLLWPAFMTHFVHPNLADEARVSISFNAVLKWSDDYLPAQP